MAQSTSKQRVPTLQSSALSIILANHGITTNRAVEGHVVIRQVPEKHSSVMDIRLELICESISVVSAEILEDEVHIKAEDSATLCCLQQRLKYAPAKDSSPRLSFHFEIPEYPRPGATPYWDASMLDAPMCLEDKASAKAAGLFQTVSEHRMPASVDMLKQLLWLGKYGGKIQYTLTATLDVDPDGAFGNGGNSTSDDESLKAQQTITYIPVSSPSDLNGDVDSETKETAQFSGTWLLPKGKRPRGLSAMLSSPKVQPRAKFSVGIACPKQMVLGRPYTCSLFFENVELSPQMEGVMPLHEVSKARFKLTMKQAARARQSPHNPRIMAHMVTETRSKEVYTDRQGHGITVEKDGQATNIVISRIQAPVDCTVSTVNVARQYHFELALEVCFNEHGTIKLKKTMDVEILPRMESKTIADGPPRYSFHE